MQEFSDQELVEAVRNNDAEAFRVLFDRYWEPFYLFAHHRLKSDGDAKDIVQELFIKIWMRRATIQINTSVKAYLNSALHYEVLSKISSSIKEESRLAVIAETILPEFTAYTDPLQIKEMLALVEEEVSRLPDRMQQVYRMSREENLSIKEISFRLNISEQTVRNQLNSSLIKLRSGLRESLLAAILMHTVL